MDRAGPLRGRAALEAVLASGRPGARRSNKYGVAPVAERTVGEVRFDSKAEAARYGELLELRRAGVVSFFLRQVPFHLPGRSRYVLDFLVFWSDGRRTFEDVKGHRTAVYKLKRRQVEELYPVVIEEVRPRVEPRRRRR